ncbi:hypothetical protein KHA80_06820 [Anaerobacillus sp. HL2]|nr:hypothetical protein KHA80_06820 [Anaerobacillus sp. HL2]
MEIYQAALKLNGKKDAFTWLANVDGDDIVSQLISQVVEKNPIKNIKINKISTEKIIRKIYEEGMATS